MKRASLLLIIVVGSSCAVLTKAASYDRSGYFPMPDVTGFTAEEARAMFAAAGITGSVDVKDNYVCDDPKVAEMRVCSTAPAAGKMTSARLPITLYLRPK